MTHERQKADRAHLFLAQPVASLVSILPSLPKTRLRTSPCQFVLQLIFSNVTAGNLHLKKEKKWRQSASPRIQPNQLRDNPKKGSSLAKVTGAELTDQRVKSSLNQTVTMHAVSHVRHKIGPTACIVVVYLFGPRKGITVAGG